MPRSDFFQRTSGQIRGFEMVKTNLALAVLLLSGSASAYFEVKPKAPEQPDAAAPVDGYQLVADRTETAVIYMGKPDPAVENLTAGQSYGVPLEAGLKVLIPTGWHAYVKDGVDPNAPVRWTNTAQNWVDALRQISRQTSTTMTVDWDRRSLFVAPQPAAATLASNAPPSVGNPLTAAQDRPLTDEERKKAEIQRQEAEAAALPPKQYSNLESFLREPVAVDLRGATIRQAMVALLPQGWKLEMDDADPYLNSIRVDLTAPGERGVVMRTLVDSVGLVVYPYTELNKAVVDKVAKK